MLKALAPGWLLISSLLISVSAVDNGFSRCNCDEEGFWSIESILECQRVSDFLIAVAYFSIPIELLYFVSCSNLPFKWVLFEFIAFIVLCGMTHLLNGWAYGPHSFQLMLALTIFKFLTALVSCATAITLLTLIPLLLKVKVRELFLKKKTWELDREVGMMKKQKETSWHVRMLTQEIRKSLDRHTILYSTLVELSKTLNLQNCVVWMPSDSKTEMNLTHELKGRSASKSYRLSIPVNDPDVLKIKESKGVQFLRPDSPLGAASSSGSDEPGAVAAIRVPLLSVLNFKGGTPEQIPTCYAILVLVLPTVTDRDWSDEVLEIVEVVADQVAVALSHAAVLEESQLMREKLVEQNHALQQAKTNAMMANQATNSFQKVMSHGMRRPMHSILGLLSIIQVEKMNFEQRIIVDTMMKTSSVLSTLINDVATSTKEQCRFSLERTSFQLHSMIKEAACLSKCLCAYRGLSFAIEVENSLPDQVIGDERRIFQVILHMVRNLLNGCERGGSVTFRIFSDSGSVGGTDQRWAVWKPVSSDGHRYVKFEIGIGSVDSPSEGLISTIQLDNRRQNSEGIEGGLSFSICKKLVQMMQGNIWVLPNSRGQAETMTLVLRLQLQSSIGRIIFETGESSEPPHSNSLFRGLQVILADADDVNRAVTKKLLEKLGCYVSSVSSGFECLSALGPGGTSFQIVFVDLHMPEMDGFEVASRIRKFRSRSWPLIVALTESADEDMWGKCMQTGMNGFIRKPVQLQGIANELRRVLQQANKGV